MSNSISRNTFVNEFTRQHGTIDLNNMSDDLKTALKDAGVTEDELKKLAGPDGQIKGAGEFKKLFSVVDQFDTTKTPNSFAPFEKPKGADPVPTASGKLYEALKNEVDKNRLEARYAQPGTKSAATQSQLTVDKNALSVPAGEQKAAVELKVKGKNQFDFEEGGKACFKAATFQCENHNAKVHGKKAPKLNGADQAIQVAYAEDKKGRLQVDPQQAKIAREYIDKSLDKGYPVLVGTSYDDHSYNIDKMTDHFVTIDSRGYDDKGRLYYEFKDPGNGGRPGRFYVDKDTGKLFKEGTSKNPQYVSQADYEVTQVRTYSGIE